MRKVNHFFKKGGRLLSMRNSVTGEHSIFASSVGEPNKLWIKATALSESAVEEVWLIEPEENQPEPQPGWYYGSGFFG